MPTPQPKCAECGKLYGTRPTKSHAVTWPVTEHMPAYKGAGLVIATHGPTPHAGINFATRDVWDGETWEHPYSPFCTLRCALIYARRAYERTSAARRAKR